MASIVRSTSSRSRYDAQVLAWCCPSPNLTNRCGHILPLLVNFGGRSAGGRGDGGGALRPGNANLPFLIDRYPQERRIVPATYRRLRMISSVTFVPDVALRATVQDVEISSIWNAAKVSRTNGVSLIDMMKSPAIAASCAAIAT